MYLLFEATGETSSIDPGPFKLSEMIEDQMRILASGERFLYWDRSDLDKLMALKVGDSFCWGLVKTVTRLPDENWVKDLYLSREKINGWDALAWSPQERKEEMEKRLGRKITCSTR